MAAPYIRTLSAVGTSNACPHDTCANPFNLSYAVVLSAGAALTCKVQITSDAVGGATDAQGTGLTWFDHPTLAGLTASAEGNIAFPITASRLVVTAYTSGSVTMTAIRAGA